MDEVVVSAEDIKKIDRTIIYPSLQTKEMSLNGLELIGNLNLPEVFLDKRSDRLANTNGGEIEYRINGVPASVSEFKSVLPQDVTRIVYHDRPALRFGNAASVIDITVRRPQSGMNGWVSANNAVTTGKGSYMLSLKSNYRKSEFSLFGSYEYSNFDKSSNTIREHMPLGPVYNRSYSTEPYHWKERLYMAYLSYTYVDEKQSFLAKSSVDFYRTPETLVTGHLNQETAEEPSHLTREKTQSSKDHTITFETYYHRKLDGKTTLAANIVSNIMDNASNSDLADYENGRKTYGLVNNLDGNKFSLLSELLLERTMDKSNLSAGMNFNYYLLRNKYLNPEYIYSRLSEYYFRPHVEWTSSIGKVSYSAGFAYQRERHSQNNRVSYTNYYQPIVKLSYNLPNNWMIRYVGNTQLNPPPIGALSDIRLTENDLMLKYGNSRLTTQSNFSNEISLNGRIRQVGCNLSFNYTYIKSPLMNDIVNTDGRYATIFFNGKRSNWFAVNGSLSYTLINNLLYYNIRGGFRHIDFKSAEYLSHLNSFQVYSGLTLVKNSFNGTLDYYGDANNLTRGMEKQFGSRMIALTARYSVGSLSFSGSAHISLVKNTGRSQITTTDYMSESSYKWYGNRPLVKLGIVYSFDYKRQFNGIRKMLENGDNDKGRF